MIHGMLGGPSTATARAGTNERSAHGAPGLPWFAYYADEEAIAGSSILKKLKSVVQMGKAKGDVPLPENESVKPEVIVRLRKGLAKGQVREGQF
jgi:hypothetical protein